MMGCFFACFGTSKHRKSQQSANIISPGDQKHEVCEDLQPIESIKQENIEKSINTPTESKEKHEEQISCNSKKKVTFDLNVTTYEEDLSTQEVTTDLLESNLEKESGKKEETQKESESLLDLITSSIVSYPQNHRYQNCTNSDGEYEDLESEESNLDDDDDDDDDQILIQEESSESLFSLSIDSRTQVSTAETGDKEVNSSMPVRSSPDWEIRTFGSNQIARDRSQYVHSVLNPIENLTQWKVVKAKKPTPSKHQSKENINIDEEFNLPFSPEPSFKPLTRNSKPNSNPPKGLDREIAVDTSLSSWLVESETTPLSVGNSFSERSSSLRSYEDRPILGALTIEELKLFSASSSPRRSPSRSPDDIPIIGTVGSYWSHTGQTIDSDSASSCKNLPNATSKYREDKGVNLESPPFEARLEERESVLDRGMAEV